MIYNYHLNDVHRVHLEWYNRTQKDGGVILSSLMRFVGYWHG